MVAALEKGAWLMLFLSVLGCGRGPAAPAGTGARESAQRYFEALVRQRWPEAYAALHPESRSALTREEFTRWAQAYRDNLGLDVDTVRVQLCEEKDAEAIAHVLLTGRQQGKARRYKEAVVLRRSAEGWGVVLPD